MYRFQTLKEIPMQELAECFNLSFSDYEQLIRFTPESLKYYLTASAVSLPLSFGAFWNGQLVAFILNSSGVYKDQHVVFDAGTGVIPEHRGKKVFSALFDYTCQQLLQHNIKKYYLEVLQNNHHAVAIYHKKGFCVQRAYSVLTATGPGSGGTWNVSVKTYQEFSAFPTKFSVDPSFEHTSYTIGQNPQLYEVRYLNNRAYCIYAKKNGTIIQLHYNEPDALEEVLCSLIHQYPSAMAKNIDCCACDVIKILTDIGFKEITKQYEMVRDI